MKEITLEDLKTEINNNLWRVTQLGLQQLVYNSHCYVRITDNQLEAVVVIDNKAMVIWSKNIIIPNNKILSSVVLYYIHSKINTMEFEEILRIEKQEMNKEIFDLLVRATELPF